VGGSADPLDQVTVEYGGRRWFVGDLALRQSDLKFFTLAEVRADEEVSRVLAMAALSLVADGAVRVVSGLPVSWYWGQRDGFTRMLLGEHVVRVSLGRQAPRDARFVVEQVRLVPQPLGSYLSRVLGGDGRMDAGLASETVGVVDIGFQTLDLFAVSRLEPIQPLCGSTRSGVASAYRWLGEALRDRFGQSRPLYELDGLARQGYLVHRGRREDLGDMLATAHDYLAGLVQADMDTLWAGANLDRVLVTGGGAYLVDGKLRCHGAAVEYLADPGNANVEGYLRLGRRDNTWQARAAS
jgi:plasmid segregation protein ParM